MADLRRKRGMSLGQLSEVMGDLGRPILASGLGKIETGERRVDADDLVTLAMALGVSPVRLLLPVEEPSEAEPDGGERDFLHDPPTGGVELAPGQFLPWERAWEWACGDEPLIGIDTYGDWQQENRPHLQRRPTGASLQQLANSARDAGFALERAALLLQRAAESEGEVAPKPLIAHFTEHESTSKRGPRG